MGALPNLDGASPWELGAVGAIVLLAPWALVIGAGLYIVGKLAGWRRGKGGGR